MTTSEHKRPVELFTERTPRVVNASKLHRSRERRKTGLFLAEGWNAVSAAVQADNVVDLYVTEEAAEQHANTLMSATHRGMYIHYIDEKADRSLADTVTPTGIYAVCRQTVQGLAEVLDAVAHPQLVLVGVDTNNPGNAGTMMRLADAFGADLIVFTGESVDPENTKCVRASAGSIFHLPVCREADTEVALQTLKGAGLQLLATTLDGEENLAHANELLKRPTAWLMGSEAHGLDPAVLALADHTVTIPLWGSAESLNLATAASICLYSSAVAQHDVIDS
ncbi:MAG TPA: RNA methyltransferase [Corynebacteriales bacterium]|nr:RNA methyltransferase [Mycobacteriales bacterium]